MALNTIPNSPEPQNTSVFQESLVVALCNKSITSPAKTRINFTFAFKPQAPLTPPVQCRPWQASWHQLRFPQWAIFTSSTTNRGRRGSRGTGPSVQTPRRGWEVSVGAGSRAMKGGKPIVRRCRHRRPARCFLRFAENTEALSVEMTARRPFRRYCLQLGAEAAWGCSRR